MSYLYNINILKILKDHLQQKRFHVVENWANFGKKIFHFNSLVFVCGMPNGWIKDAVLKEQTTLTFSVEAIYNCK